MICPIGERARGAYSGAKSLLRLRSPEKDSGSGGRWPKCGRNVVRVLRVSGEGKLTGDREPCREGESLTLCLRLHARSCGQRIGGAISCSNFAYVPTRLTSEVGCPPGYSLDRTMHSNRSRQAGKQASSGCSVSGKAQTFRNHEGFPNVCDVPPIAIGWGGVSVMWCRCICVHFREV